MGETHCPRREERLFGHGCSIVRPTHGLGNVDTGYTIQLHLDVPMFDILCPLATESAPSFPTL